MGDIIWRVGMIHLTIYALLGGSWLMMACIVKAHMHAKVMGRIIQWHNARGRWSRRFEHGLTDAEWKAGDPRP